MCIRDRSRAPWSRPATLRPGAGPWPAPPSAPAGCLPGGHTWAGSWARGRPLVSRPPGVGRMREA
eukprot:1839096-Alexandrium_andersonii.AAC.1